MAVIIVLLDAIEVDFHTDKQILALISKFIPNVEVIEKLNKYAMKCSDFEYQMHHTAPHFLGQPLRKIFVDLFLTTYDFFLKTRTRIAKYWKRHTYSLKLPHLSQDFFTLLKT